MRRKREAVAEKCKHFDKVRCKCSAKPKLLGVLRRSCPLYNDSSKLCPLFKLKDPPKDERPSTITKAAVISVRI